METVLLHKSAFLYVTSIFRLSSFVFANALLTGITKTFVPFYSSFPEICGKSAGTYALTTETADGLVASAYDVKVTEKAVSAITVTSLKALSVDINKELDLIGCFKNTAVATVDGTAVADLTPYIVDYYFEIADKTAAANLGATISGNTIKAEKAGSLNIKVNAARKSKVDDNTARMQSIKQLGV